MKILVLLGTLFLLFISCHKDNDMDVIDSNILVSAEKSGTEILLNAETKRIYPTLGHQITFRDEVKKKDVYIKFEKIKVPKIGLTALGPATCSIRLGELENGEYDVVFELNKKKTKGKLIIGEITELNIYQEGNVKPKE